MRNISLFRRTPQILKNSVLASRYLQSCAELLSADNPPCIPLCRTNVVLSTCLMPTISGLFSNTCFSARARLHLSWSNGAKVDFSISCTTVEASARTVPALRARRLASLGRIELYEKIAYGNCGADRAHRSISKAPVFARLFVPV